MSAGDDEDDQHFPRGFRDRPQREQRERQQHELHPARHHHARGLALRGDAAGSWSVCESVSSRSCSDGGSAAGRSASRASSPSGDDAETPLTCLPPSPEYG